MLNLTTIKAAAELAKTSPLNRDEWGEDIDPDDVLRLVEVARAAKCVLFAASKENLRDLKRALKGIEYE